MQPYRNIAPIEEKWKNISESYQDDGDVYEGCNVYDDSEQVREEENHENECKLDQEVESNSDRGHNA